LESLSLKFVWLVVDVQIPDREMHPIIVLTVLALQQETLVRPIREFILTQSPIPGYLDCMTGAVNRLQPPQRQPRVICRHVTALDFLGLLDIQDSILAIRVGPSHKSSESTSNAYG